MTTRPFQNPRPLLILHGEGGSITLMQAELAGPAVVTAQEDPVLPGGKVFWIERSEWLAEDLEEATPPSDRSPRRITGMPLPEAVAELLDPYPWWLLHPSQVDPKLAEVLRDALERRFPGWLSHPERFGRAWPNAWDWREALLNALDRRWTWSRPPSPEALRVCYAIAPSFHRMHGIYLELMEQPTPSAQAWPLPSTGACEMPRWAPEEPGVILTPRASRELAARLDQAWMGLMMRGEHGLDGATFTLSIARGCHRVELTWWQDLPENAAGLHPLIKHLERCMTRLGFRVAASL